MFLARARVSSSCVRAASGERECSGFDQFEGGIHGNDRAFAHCLVPDRTLLRGGRRVVLLGDFCPAAVFLKESLLGQRVVGEGPVQVPDFIAQTSDGLVQRTPEIQCRRLLKLTTGRRRPRTSARPLPPRDLARINEIIAWISAEDRPPIGYAADRRDRSMANRLSRRQREAAEGTLHPANSAGFARVPG